MSEKPDTLNAGNDYQIVWNTLDTEDAYAAMEALNRIIAERDIWKARAEKAEELVKTYEDGSRSIELKLGIAEAERDEYRARVEKAEGALINCADYCLTHKVAEPGIILALLKIRKALAGRKGE